MPIPAAPLYISIDLDALDPAFAPGVSHHEPGGLSIRDILSVLHRIDAAESSARDMVEYNPSRDINGMTATVAAKLVKELQHCQGGVRNELEPGASDFSRKRGRDCRVSLAPGVGERRRSRRPPIKLPSPIGRAERAARLARARALMQQHGIGSIVIEPGASLDYFTGVQWWRSERLTAAVIPVRGDPIIVTPFFEKPSVQESLGITAEVRVWQEDEEPLKLVADFLKERGGRRRPDRLRGD